MSPAAQDSPSSDAAADQNAKIPVADASADADDGGLSPCSADGWCYTDLPRPGSFDAGNPVNSGQALFALSSVWVAPDHRAWAADVSGNVLDWDGSTWRVVFVASGGVRSVWGTSSTDVWLAGDFGLLHGTGDRPEALVFVPVAAPTSRRLTRVWGTSATDVWVLSDGVNGVFHLAASTASGPSPFAPVVPPDGDAHAGTSRIVSAVWGTASETWLAGMQYDSCAPPDCTSKTSVVAFQRSVAGDGSETWKTVTMPVPKAVGVINGVSTAPGQQLLALQATPMNTALAARVTNGAWTSELVEDYGQPAAMWGERSDDVWLVGFYGVVRHFDGTAWQLSRVTRSPYVPLVNNLHSIDAFVDPSGDQDMWIVGDDVALHRTVKP